MALVWKLLKNNSLIQENMHLYLILLKEKMHVTAHKDPTFI